MGLRTAPVNRLTRNSTKNTTNSTLAIQAASAATTKKPNAPAIRAMTKNVKAQLNMIVLLSFERHEPGCELRCHGPSRLRGESNIGAEMRMLPAVAAEIFMG
jgi:hypothetical protein